MVTKATYLCVIMDRADRKEIDSYEVEIEVDDNHRFATEYLQNRCACTKALNLFQQEVKYGKHKKHANTVWTIDSVRL